MEEINGMKCCFCCLCYWTAGTPQL